MSKKFLDSAGVQHLYSKINNKLKLAMEVVDTAISEIELTPGPKGDTGEQGPKGDKGEKGDDGVSVSHSWNDTTLTVISASGVSSSDLKGDTGNSGVYIGSTEPQDPEQLVWINPEGIGSNTIPIKGVDYWTDEDKAEIINAIIEFFGGSPITGYVDENNNVIVTGNLSNGTYNIKYELEDGTTIDIGELTLTEKEPDTPTYTNLAQPNTDNTTDFTIWCNNARIGSDGVVEARDGYVSTNFVEVSPGDVVRLKNFKVERLCFYDIDKNPTNEGIQRPGRHIANSYIQDASADIDLVADINGEPTEMTFTINPTAQPVSSVAYLRLSGHLTGTADDVIITVNEEIV